MAVHGESRVVRYTVAQFTERDRLLRGPQERLRTLPLGGLVKSWPLASLMNTAGLSERCARRSLLSWRSLVRWRSAPPLGSPYRGRARCSGEIAITSFPVPYTRPTGSFLPSAETASGWPVRTRQFISIAADAILSFHIKNRAPRGLPLLSRPRA